MAHAFRSAKGHHGPQRSCPAPRRHSQGHHSRSQAAMRNLHRGRHATAVRCAQAWPREGQRGGQGQQSRRRCCKGAAGRRARKAAWRSRRCRYCRGPDGPKANGHQRTCLLCRIRHHSRCQEAEAEASSQARHGREASLKARRLHRRHRHRYRRLHRRGGEEVPRRLRQGSMCVQHKGEGAPVIHATEEGASMSSAPHQPGADAIRLERKVVDDYLEVVELVLRVERVYPLRVNRDELASKGAEHVVAPRGPDETVVKHRAPQQQHTRHAPREASDQIIGEDSVATLGLLHGLHREQQPQPLSCRRLILEGRLRPNRRQQCYWRADAFQRGYRANGRAGDRRVDAELVAPRLVQQALGRLVLAREAALPPPQVTFDRLLQVEREEDARLRLKLREARAEEQQDEPHTSTPFRPTH
ncbi:hypothetical protein T492DRAFT_992856 [Pavlovales sp. CCMP2436]|nr:hypothetical protein T492DRAFT_992856 [Pavlovales sp. CCMP2436]